MCNFFFLSLKNIYIIYLRNHDSTTCLLEFFVYHIDTNECEMENICEVGKCKNIIGGYECVCNAGYKHRFGDKTTCIGYNLK